MAFVLPSLLFFVVFKYGPMLWAIGLSFTSYDMVSTPQFIGLENYRSLVVGPGVPRHLGQHAGLCRRARLR